MNGETKLKIQEMLLRKTLDYKKIMKYAIYTAFAIIFVWVSSQLFFESETLKVLASVKGIFAGEGMKDRIIDLGVVYPDEPLSLEPTSLNPSARQRLLNIYEPLVRPDRDLKMKPALALSWGLIDNLTWEFRLRPNVIFHDGTGFDAADVAVSFERAMTYSGSEISAALSSIKELEIIDDYTLRILTFKPDPLLLQRIATVLIIPSEYENEADFDPVGTGSYKFKAWDKNDKIVLERFSEYWGTEAKFAIVEMFSRVNKNERVGMFVNYEADLLAFVPFDAVTAIKERNFKITEIPSLEVQFLLFNMDSQYFSDKKNRELFSYAIDQKDLVAAVGGYARIVNQFVSNGIFGFNPDIQPHEYDLKKAEELAEETGLKGKTIQFHLSKGLDVLGEHVRQQLNGIGVNTIVSYLEADKLMESIVERKADIYFFGFKSDLGDSADFLGLMARSGADFNAGKYSNSVVDEMIDVSLLELDPIVRLENLREAMRIIVEDDIFGVPLFEYETLFSFSDKLDMEPRIDGFIYFDELNLT